MAGDPPRQLWWTLRLQHLVEAQLISKEQSNRVRNAYACSRLSDDKLKAMLHGEGDDDAAALVKAFWEGERVIVCLELTDSEHNCERTDSVDSTPTRYQSVFMKKPSYAELVDFVESAFHRFEKEAYILKSDQIDIGPTTWNILDPKPSEPHYVVQVCSVRQPFSSITLDDGYRMLGVSRMQDEVLVAKTDLTMDEELADTLQKSTRFKTVEDLMLHLGDDLAARMIVSNPQDDWKLARGCRELIGPVLMAAALLAKGVKIKASMSVTGVHAAGVVDWAMLYKGMSIVVFEAELYCKWEDYLGQVAAEILAAREEYVLSVLGKRKREVDDTLAKVPTWAIITNGLSYKFVKFVTTITNEGKLSKELLGSDTIPVPLVPGMDTKRVVEVVSPVVAYIRYVLEQQKQALDQR
mmetsp:Transcript_2177/g.4886  ORF Transcript_2177/g.4886 Transcript_2177/m.4886 type:complete len:410 (-) Transcript_2177:550-1779(-)